MAERDIVPANRSSSFGARRSRDYPLEDQPMAQRPRVQPESSSLKWYDDIERATVLAHRKLTAQIYAKEKQIVELDVHLDRGTAPNWIKVSVSMPVMDALTRQADDSMTQTIGEAEKSLVKMACSIKNAEVKKLRKELTDMIAAHKLKVQCRMDRLLAEDILSSDTPYNFTSFMTHLQEDGRNTRLLCFKQSEEKQQKRQALAAKKASEKMDETLVDPVVESLKKKVFALEKRLAKSTSNKQKQGKPKKNAGKPTSSKNASGPGKSANRGPVKGTKGRGQASGNASRKH